MVECWLPYGNTEVHISVPIRNLLGTIEPRDGQPVLDPREAILRSLQEPIGSKSVTELAVPRSKVAVAIDGTMSPRLVVLALRCIVESLRKVEYPMGEVSVLVGYGLREYRYKELLEAISSSEVLRGLKVIEHQRGSRNITSLGTTSKGTEVKVCSHLVDSDVRIAIGQVMIDHFSGMRGAQTTILPALSSLETIEQNRNLSFRGEVTPGISEGNPVQADIMEATSMAGVDLAVNLVTNGRGEVVSVCSGELNGTWKKALEDFDEIHKSEAEGNADIVIVSAGGSRFDFDLYNSVWALKEVPSIARKGAAIILLSECKEGLGADGLETLAQVDDLDELRRRYMLGARAVHLIKSTLRRSEITMVSALPHYLAESLGIKVERTANEAYRRVVEGRRRGRRTLVITHGCSTVPYSL